MGDYVVADARDGSKTLLYRNGREIKIHSSYEPDREAGRAVQAFNVGRASLIVVSGAGLGYHIRRLKQANPGIPMLVLERDPEVESLARRHCPENLTDITVFHDGADVADFMESFTIEGFTGIANYVHRPSYSIDPGFYDGVLEAMHRQISSKISDLLTRFEFERNWMRNISHNLPRLFDLPRVASLFGRFRGYPAVIVSAGPSLRKNAALLPEIRDRALIVCVDTAVKVLDRMGISPHIILTLDAQKHSLKHFLGLRNRAPLLVADMVSYPPITRDYAGPCMMSTTSKYFPGPGGALYKESTPFMDWIERFIGPVGDIQSGGSVATSAFDMLLNFGCEPIILLGQDLAYTGREIHCTGTHHNDGWLPRIDRFENLETINQKVIRLRKIKFVESVGPDPLVISDFVFDLYRGWFMDAVAKVSFPVINATEGGARIAGTIEKTLRQVADGLPPLRETPSQIIAAALGAPAHESPRRLVAALREALPVAGEIGSRAASGEPAAALLEAIENSPLSPLYHPLLRKARTFSARYGGTGGDERVMLGEIEKASHEIVSLATRALAGLERA